VPKELTHWLLADKAFAGLSADSQLRVIIEDNYASYRGGAVLPDTLLHLFRGPHAAAALAASHTFHNTSGNSFAPLIQAESHFPAGFPADYLACMLGVISHMVADIVFHPYVYSLSGSDGIGQHYRIETDIDCHFLCNGTISAKLKLNDLLPGNTRKTLINVAALLFDPCGTLPRAALEQALSLHCRFQAMYNSTLWKLAVRLLARIAGSPFKEQRYLFYPLSRSLHCTCLNANTPEWRHPVTGEPQFNTLEELTDEAVRRTIVLYTLIEESGSLASALCSKPGENLLTGLHGVQLNTSE
jgi:hypothetical protein